LLVVIEINPISENKELSFCPEKGDKMPEVSVVMPCLNEEKTVGVCIKKCLKVFKENNIDGEVIVVDNGSVDNSPRVARETGAKVVFEPRKGYGRAYLRGFSEAGGEYIITLDADGQHNPQDIPRFYRYLKHEGYDLVIGFRSKESSLGSTSPFNQYLGNPILSKILNLFFCTNFSDITSGYRGFRRSALERLDLRCRGMELAPEILIKASKKGLGILEIPIEVKQRVCGKSKLSPLYDGWGTFRLMILFAPTWLFFIPGILFFVIGLFLIFAILSGHLTVWGIEFGLHPMIFGAFLAILGLQVITFGIQSKIYVDWIGLESRDTITNFVKRNFTVEKGSLVGGLIFIAGVGGLIYIFNKFVATRSIDEIRLLLLSMTLTVIGLQIIFSAWFLSIFDLVLGKMEEVT